MKAYKMIIAGICALALLCMSINALADNGYDVTFKNNNSVVTVTLTNDLGKEIDILTDETLALKTNGRFPSETSTGTTVLSFGAWSKGIVAANNPASAGDIGYYCLPSSKAFSSVLTGDIEDYNLEVTFSKEAQNAYIDNIEVGFGNANGTSGYGSLPTVVKTYPLGDFGYVSAANHTEWTITLDVKDILEKGNETRFPGTNGGTVNELTGSNINLFTVKGTYRMESSATAKMIQFSRIMLVPKANSSAPVLPDSYALITAFYDKNGNLISFDYDNNAPESLTTSVPENAHYMRSFVWSNFAQSILPVRPKYETLVPIKLSVLFVGGRGAYDSSTKLRALSQAEGFDINVYCIYYNNRELRDHWRNACTGTSDYSILANGNPVNDTKVSLQTALQAQNYDYVILEQSSGYAGVDDSIFPYLNYLETFIKEKCTRAAVCYNTLWPFKSDYTGSIFEFYDKDTEVMRDKINETAAIIEDETEVTVINTNNIVYTLANVDGYSLYSKESDTSVYRLNSVGQAAVQAQIFYSLTNKKPAAASIMSCYPGVSISMANAIIGYIE